MLHVIEQCNISCLQWQAVSPDVTQMQQKPRGRREPPSGPRDSKKIPPGLPGGNFIQDGMLSAKTVTESLTPKTVTVMVTVPSPSCVRVQVVPPSLGVTLMTSGSLLLHSM